MNSQNKLFAFKLAAKQPKIANNGTWKVRDGIASAQACCFTSTGEFEKNSVGNDTSVRC